MKALFPAYCRPLGYFILLIALVLPFILVMGGVLTDANLLFYKECSKLLMILGAVFILFALSKEENRETEVIRSKATRNAIFLTLIFLVMSMFFRVFSREELSIDHSSFLTFLIVNVICLEFGMNKARADKIFKR